MSDQKEKQPNLVLVMVSCGNGDEAQKLADLLVSKSLAACAQIYDIHSVYKWQGEIESEPEVMLHLKTLEKKIPEIEALVKKEHSYDVPEIIALPIIWAEKQYAKWLDENV